MTHPSHAVERMQSLLRELRIPAWLFYDFRGSDPIAHRILGLDPGAHATRRWFYLVPARGTPVKIVHRIESERLDALPGEKVVYLVWNSLHRALADRLRGLGEVAMQYSPRNAIPYISKVDAGTIELVRSAGVEVVSSADLIQHLESVWSPEQADGHRKTALTLTRLIREAFAYVEHELKAGRGTSEYSVQQFLLQRLLDESLETDFPPIVAVNRNSGNPHYCPEAGDHLPIARGDFLLIDLWARPTSAESVFADITWTGTIGSEVPVRVREIFDCVRAARDAGVSFLRRRLEEGVPIQGFEVDDAVRSVIEKRGYAEFFIHRTGHNLGTEVHGNGVNFDDLETHDERRVLPGVCCTIEPGIYLPEFGVRSEINVLIGEFGLEVTTPPQEDLLTCAF
jgi:Xaa-Pro dipeptidase